MRYLLCVLLHFVRLGGRKHNKFVLYQDYLQYFLEIPLPSQHSICKTRIHSLNLPIYIYELRIAGSMYLHCIVLRIVLEFLNIRCGILCFISVRNIMLYFVIPCVLFSDYSFAYLLA